MISFDHVTAATTEDAISQLRNGASSAVIAGGTDLIPLMKERIAQPELLIDIKQVGGLSGITAGEDGVTRIGALVTLSELEEALAVAEGYAVLVDAVRLAASPQLRNMATIGGNLLQRPRCWYFRGDFHCWLKGGEVCFAVDGENQHHAIFDSHPCVAAHPSDLAPALIALGASVEVTGDGGTRTIPVEQFFRNPTEDRRLEHVLEQGELVSAVTLPAPAPGSRGVYLKAMEREAWAFALASVAVRVELDGATVRECAVVLGGVATTPRRASAAEDALTGRALGPDSAAAAAEAAVREAQPLSRNGYKLPLVRNLVRRALLQLGGGTT